MWRVFAMALFCLAFTNCQKFDSNLNQQYFLYAPDGVSSVAQFSVNGQGNLTALTPGSVVVGNVPRSVSATPSGAFAYATNYHDSTISQFEITTDGTLTPLTTATISGVSSPFNSMTSPDGNYLYVLNDAPANSISQFSIGSTGQLTPLAISSVGLASKPVALVFSPSGNYAFACTSTTQLLYVFSVVNGDLNTLQGPLNTSAACGALAISPNGEYLYAGLSNSSILQYAVAPAGTLTPLVPSTVSGLGTGIDSLVVTPNGSFLYAGVFNGGLGDGPVTGYSIGAKGTLAPLSPASITAGNSPFALLVTGDGNTIFCANSNDGTITNFSVHSSGQLTATGLTTVGTEAYYPALVAK